MSKFLNQISDEDDQHLDPRYSLPAILSAVSALIFMVTSTVWVISVVFTIWQTPNLDPSFDQGVTKPLKLATQAGSLATAKSNIRVSLDFIRKDPQIQAQLNDESADSQEFLAWVHNLEDTQQSLEQIKDDASFTEQVATLDWLNQRLTESNGLGGESVIIPNLLPGSFKLAFHPLLLGLMLSSSPGFVFFLFRKQLEG